MYIGADMRDGVSFFGGYMADVALYGYVLSASQVRTHALVGVNGALKLTVSGSFAHLVGQRYAALLARARIGRGLDTGSRGDLALRHAGQRPRFYRLVFR